MNELSLEQVACADCSIGVGPAGGEGGEVSGFDWLFPGPKQVWRLEHTCPRYAESNKSDPSPPYTHQRHRPRRERPASPWPQWPAGTRNRGGQPGWGCSRRRPAPPARRRPVQRKGQDMREEIWRTMQDGMFDAPWRGLSYASYPRSLLVPARIRWRLGPRCHQKRSSAPPGCPPCEYPSSICGGARRWTGVLTGEKKKCRKSHASLHSSTSRLSSHLNRCGRKTPKRNGKPRPTTKKHKKSTPDSWNE